ncbi:MAG: trypsin-like peptidase domain-containing protein [Myxococcaceae bacterium]|nr:trypsin-like peptidase domain-containing protein [Myxococcaceae bacterium]
MLRGRMHRLFALSLSIAATATGAGELSDWIAAQARAHSQHLQDVQKKGGGGGSLWRERGSAGPLLPDFVPPTSLAPLVKAVSPGVVNVSSLLDAPSSGLRGGNARRSLGSGFIISPDGFVVTNSHVIASAQSILVQLADGREYLADVVGRDASTDVALLRLEGSPGDLPTVYLGDSDALEVGDWVVAIGNPFGLDHSISHGMISAKERVLGIGVFDDFIQTDALINPGNSGGPLFNMRGEVVGVNTAIMSQGQGIGFAVPINMVKELIPNLRDNGKLARGWLGVNIVEGVSAHGKGAVVSDVFRGSPAAQAGLAPGDRVLGVNGATVQSFQQLLRKISFLAPGTRATLLVERDGRQLELTVTLAQRPSSRMLRTLAEADRADALGLILRELTADLARPLGLEPRSGVLVAGVIPGSAAEQSGLRAGDLITEANKRQVRAVKELQAAVEASDADAVLLRLRRGDLVRYVAVPVR